MAKSVYYAVNGSGRDSYIANNNGGLSAPIENNIYEVGKLSYTIFTWFDFVFNLYFRNSSIGNFQM